MREFLSSREYRLTVLDTNRQALKRIGDSRVSAIAGEGCFLPFRDSTFDVVVSVDSLEHVPGGKKTDYCNELKRVARRYVIVHCPSDSVDGQFQGTICDTRFLEWYRHRFKKDEPNTLEHLKSGLPKVEELRKFFPHAATVGKQNTGVWLKYMTRAQIQYRRLTNGLFYKLHLQKQDDQPPYHACLLVWRKR